MRLLKIKIEGLTLFPNMLEIDFFAEQRVSKDNQEVVYNVFKNVYTNNIISLVGINASGKTTALRIISFVLELLNGQSINSIKYKSILSESEVVNLDLYFTDGEFIYRLQTCILNDGEEDSENQFIIKTEKLWKKDIVKVKTKKDLFSFDEKCLFRERDDKAEYLRNDSSIVLSVNRNNDFYINNLLPTTDINLLRLAGNFPYELISFLDSSVEYLIFEKEKKEFRLKFFGKEEISIPNVLLLHNYLSSGTIKGFNVFLHAITAFEKGGYLIVDELENHFNREIVATLIRFFANEKINCNGATLIFSTHYSEILDEFERNDGIYILRNSEGLSIQKLSEVLKRNDIKKSEAFKSGYLNGTAPSYEKYMDLKKAILRRIEKGAE